MAKNNVGAKSEFASLKSVQDATLQKIKLSGLDSKDAKLLGYDAFHASTLLAQVGPLPAVASGFRIPYFDLEGRQTKFWRFRYLESTKNGFDALTNKKPLRYAQPAKTVNELYIPPMAGLNWKTIAADNSIPLIFTEGELKAACATKHGYPCIGLGGVWCFKSNNARHPLLPQFKEFNWKGRAVYIAYDSDAVSNHMVMQAENALARELMLMGAEPFVVRIPPGEEKMGLDDYIMAHGAEAFGKLLHDATEWRAARELFKLNEEVIYVRDPGIILRLDTLQRITAQAFTQHAYSTRIYHEEQVSDKGTKLVERSAAKEWLKWPARGEVQRVGYTPGIRGVTPEGEFSVWRGWGCEPEKGDVSPWNELLDFLFASEPQHRKWFEQWCAYPVQHPGTKLYTCCLFWGTRHGTGKSLVGYTLGSVYGSNFTEIKSKNLHDAHNEWAENKQFVMGDEISANDNKRSVSDHMKGIITQLKLRLNPKYIPSYEVIDCINYFFTSNHPNSFFLEDDDRRNFILEVIGSPLGREFYKRYDAWLKGSGPSHLFHHLLSVDLTGFEPLGHAPDSRAKREMTETGRSDIASWVNLLKESPDTVLRMDGVVLKNDLWRSEELLHIYDPDGRGRVSPNGLSRELKIAGFAKLNKGMGVYTTQAGQVRLWAVRNEGRYLPMSGADIGKMYDKERGIKVGKDDKAKKPKF